MNESERVELARSRAEAFRQVPVEVSATTLMCLLVAARQLLESWKDIRDYADRFEEVRFLEASIAEADAAIQPFRIHP